MDVIACLHGMDVIACLYGMDVIACLHGIDVIACLHGMNMIACLYGMDVIACLHDMDVKLAFRTWLLSCLKKTGYAVLSRVNTAYRAGFLGLDTAYGSKGIRRIENWLNAFSCEDLAPMYVQGFQDSPDDEEDTRSSEEYMNDLEIEFHERALLAKLTRFFKKCPQRFSNAKATDKTKCYKCEDMSYNDNEMVKVKVLMELADDESGVDLAEEVSERKSHIVLGIAHVEIIDRQLPFEYTITSRSTDVVVLAQLVQNINHSAFRSMFEREKLSGNNFNDWFRQLKLVLGVENKMYVTEQPLPVAPAANSAAQVLSQWNAVYDAYNEVACLILGSMTLELHRQFENSSPYDMIKELKSMFEK
ncbi:hypothetical protein Tco_0322668 [Tanacetum coccineum]